MRVLALGGVAGPAVLSFAVFGSATLRTGTSLVALIFLVALVGSLEARALTGLWQRLMLGALFLWNAVVGFRGFCGEENMEDNERIVREFIAAWSRLDPVELAGYFAEDGVYHNMPMGPVAGRGNVEDLIRGFVGSWTETTWDLLNLVAAGDIVIAERLDRTHAGDKSVDLPCVGVFELESGKIKVWRDYFDFATYQRGLG